MVRTRRSALWFLLALFLVSWVAHAWYEWLEFEQNAKDHDTPVVVSEYVVSFLRATFENWQSEFLQIIVAAFAFKHFFWTGTPESKDTE